MTLVERFLKYVNIPTTSNSANLNNPSSENQRLFAYVLIKDLEEMGINDIYYDEEHCYLYACLKGNTNAPKIGFITHLDTCEDVKGDNIKPQFIYNYDGSNIVYPNGLMINTDSYPELLKHKGKTLITTDGTTLLGGDDKAGIAEVMSMSEYFKTENLSHGDIYVCFTPDEEIGLGTLNFDFSKFPVDFAYTVDGSACGEISYENFNAATATIKIDGVVSHCGQAKGTMINAGRIATVINSLLPEEIPENTENYEGFFYLEEITGNVSNAKMKYLIRDFDKNNFEKRKLILTTIIEKLNQKYNGCISLEIKNSYSNMYDHIKNHLHLIETVKINSKKLGIPTIITPIRGGTDGTDISEKGIPCPNLGTGSYNFHSVYEYVCVEEMEKVKELLINIILDYSRKDIMKLKRISN